MEEFELGEQRLEVQEGGAWLEVRYTAISQELSIRAMVTGTQGNVLWNAGMRAARADLRLVGPAAAAFWAALSQRPAAPEGGTARNNSAAPAQEQ